MKNPALMATPENTASGVPFELELLTNARNYQKWVAHAVAPFLGKRILEVGAGIGNMSQHLPVRELLVLTETEPHLLKSLEKNAERLGQSAKKMEAVHVQQVDLSKSLVPQLVQHNFDTVVSFNVFEHIENDEAALKELLELLQKSQASGPKHLITFVPAHQWSYGSLDRVFGHHRRYSKRDFKKLAHTIGFSGKLHVRYFNLAGLPGWFMMNKVFRKTLIGPTAVKSFEKICPYIRGVDDFLHEKLHLPLGQSLLAVMTIEEKIK